jgi:hypothetical protein
MQNISYKDHLPKEPQKAKVSDGNLLRTVAKLDAF